MATSKVDLCNAALGRLGQDVTIASLTEQSKNARAFGRVYDRVVDYVLTECRLPSCVRTVVLAELTEPAFGWAYRYAYPADCLDAIALHGPNSIVIGGSWLHPDAWGNWLDRYAYDFEVQDGTQDKSIVTGMANASLTYISNAAPIDRWGPLLQDAVVCRLAVEVAPVVAAEVGIRLGPALEQNYMLARSRALVHALNESSDTYTPMTPALVARQ